MSAATPPWVDGLTIGQMLRESTRRLGDREALVFPRLKPDESPREPGEAGDCFRLSFRELDMRVDQVARALLALGLQKGEHVAVWATNWPRWVLLQFATARIGAVLVTINPAYRKAELAYVLKQSDASVLFLVDEFRRSNYFAILKEAILELAAADGQSLALEHFPRLKHIIAMKGPREAGIVPWDEFLSQADIIAPEQLAARERELRPPSRSIFNTRRERPAFPKGRCSRTGICF